MKKFFALLLSVLMLCAMAGMAFAAETEVANGSITITNATIGAEYTLYPIFDATYDEELDAASYTITRDHIQYAPLFGTGTTPSNSYFDLQDSDGDGIYQVFIKTNISEDDIRGFLQQEVNLNQLQSSTSTTANSTTVVFDNLQPGYYVVDTNNGAGLVTITNAKPDAEIIDKNQVPTGTKKYVAKKASDGTSTNNWKDDYIEVEFEETYEYRLTIGTTPNYHNDKKITQYYLVDTYGSSVHPDLSTTKVIIGSDTELTKGWYVPYGEDPYALGTWTATDINEAEFVVIADQTGKNEFTVIIPFMAGYTVDATTGTVTDGDGTGDFIYTDKNGIAVTFDAYLDQDATIGTGVYDSNNNVVDANFKTTEGDEDIGEDPAHVNTYGQKFNKIDGTTEKTPLAGVEFKLYSDREHQNPINVVMVEDGLYKVSKESEDNTIITPDDGEVVILGLDADTYYLLETQALPGYNLPNDHFNLSLDPKTTKDTATEEFVFEETTHGVFNYGEIVNNQGALLPETGAMGTLMFTVVGIVLVMGAAVFMITRKKMTAYVD